jgi:NAD-specific glutamate dehydrogenase
MLLLHVRGATSFEHLRTVVNPETQISIVHLSFEEAAKALQLVDDDQEWIKSMRDAVETQMPRQLRLLFATILAYCGPMNPVDMWIEFQDSMVEDVQFRFVDIPIEEAHNLALFEIQKLLQSMGSSLLDIGLNQPVQI